MADWRQYFYGQKVTAPELRAGFDGLERADRAIVGDLGLIGITSGGVVTQHSPTADLTVDVTALKAFDQQGRRVQFAAGQTVNLAVDSLAVSTNVANPGQGKIISVFAKFKRALSDPRLDKNGAPVDFVQDESFEFVVVQGAEAGSPTPPALLSDGLLLADVLREYGDTQLLNADVSTTRRENAFKLAAGAMTVETGTPEASDAAILVHLNGHVTGVANSHPASTIDYAGGPAWLGGRTNPTATVEAQLDKIITDLGATTAADDGAERIGIQARTAWLGGRTNVASDVFVAIDKIITDLGATTATDDGAERIGAQAVSGSYAAGSVRTQLDEVCTAAQTISGVKRHTVDINLEPSCEIVFTSGGTPTARVGYSVGPPFGFKSGALVQLGGLVVAPGDTVIWELPSNIPDGATLTQTVMNVDPVSSTAGVNVKLSLYRKSRTASATATVWTVTDPLSGGAYTSFHELEYATSHVVDRDYAYFFELVGESGGTPGNVEIQPPRYAYSLPGLNLLAGGG